MAEYVDCFAEHDIWAQSTLTEQTQNRLWAIDDLVPAEAYSRSIFYNEWIRSMGDDTYHCAGMSIKTPAGTGLIGLHRARSGGAFDHEALAILQEQITPLQRLMRVRAILAEARVEGNLYGDALDRFCLEVFIVERDGRIAHMTPAAQTRLQSQDPLRILQGKLCATQSRNASLVATAIARATSRIAPEITFSEIYCADGQSLALIVTPVLRNSRRCAMLVLRAVECVNTERQLQTRFSLTVAEADVASALARGLTPGEIADERRASVLTVRTQIKTIADKMGCRRQAEIVANVLQTSHTLKR